MEIANEHIKSSENSLRRKRGRISDKVREVIVRQASRGYNNAEIGRNMKVTTRSVSNILSVYHKEGRIEALPRRGGKPARSLTKIEEEQIVDWVASNPNMTVRSVIENFKQNAQSVSPAAISRFLKSIKSANETRAMFEETTKMVFKCNTSQPSLPTSTMYNMADNQPPLKALSRAAADSMDPFNQALNAATSKGYSGAFTNVFNQNMMQRIHHPYIKTHTPMLGNRFMC